MLDIGFIHALRRIAKHLPTRRQTLLFSATMPRPIVELSRELVQRGFRSSVISRGGLLAAQIEADRGVHSIDLVLAESGQLAGSQNDRSRAVGGSTLEQVIGVARLAG